MVFVFMFGINARHLNHASTHSEGLSHLANVDEDLISSKLKYLDSKLDIISTSVQQMKDYEINAIVESAD